MTGSDGLVAEGHDSEAPASPLSLAVKLLLTQLQHGGQEERVKAVQRLIELTGEGSLEDESTSAEEAVFPPLLSLVEVGQYSAGVLSSLAQSCKNEGLVGKLAELVSSGQHSLASQGAAVIANLASASAEARQDLVQQGAIFPLVALLWDQEGGNEAKEVAAAALANLAAGGSEEAALVAAYGGIPALARLLENKSSHSIKHKAAAGLARIASVGDREAQLISQLGAIPKLLENLQSSADGPVLDSFAYCLACICDRVPEGQIQAVATGGVQILLQLLRSAKPGESLEVSVAWALGALAKQEQGRVPAAIPPLVAMLLADETSLRGRERAIASLDKVIWGDEIATTAAVTDGIVPIAVQALEEGGPQVREAAAGILASVANNTEHHASLLAAHPIPGLVAALGIGPLGCTEKSAIVLQALSSEGNLPLEGVSVSPFLQQVVLLLHAGSSAAQEAAAGILVGLSLQPEGQWCILSTHEEWGGAEGGVANEHPTEVAGVFQLRSEKPQLPTPVLQALLWALGRGSPSVVGRAAQALRNLVKVVHELGEDEERALVEMLERGGKGGAIPYLVQVLRTGSDSARENAAAIIEALVAAQMEPALRRGEKPRTSIAETSVAYGLIGFLVDLLSVRHLASTRATAASALWRLLSSWPEGAAPAAGEGAVAPLLVLLEDAPPPAQRSAGLALGALLAGHKGPGPEAATVFQNGMNLLIKVLRTGVPLAWEGAAEVIKEMVTHHPARHQDIVEQGGLSPLVGLLLEGTAPAQAAAGHALAVLCEDEEVAAAVGAEGAIPLLVELLREEHPGPVSLKEGAAAALAALSRTPSLQALIAAEDDVIAALGALLQGPTPYAQQCGLLAVHRLASSTTLTPEFQERLSALALLLSSLLKFGLPETRERAALAAQGLVATPPGCQAVALAEGVVPALVRLLTTGSPTAQEAAAGAIAGLAAEEGGSRRAVAAEVPTMVPVIIALLRTGTPGTQDQAARAVAALAMDPEVKKLILNQACWWAPPTPKQPKPPKSPQQGTPNGWGSPNPSPRPSIGNLSRGISGRLERPALPAIRGAASDTSSDTDSRPATPEGPRLLRGGEARPQLPAPLTPPREDQLRLSLEVAGLPSRRESELRVANELVTSFSDWQPPRSSVDSSAPSTPGEWTLGSEGPVAPLVRLLHLGTPTGREAAAGALLELAIGASESLLLAMSEEAIIPPTARLLLTGTIKARENGAGIVRELAREPTMRRILAKKGLIPTLVGMLSPAGPEKTQQMGAGALRSLALDDDNRKAIARTGGLGALVMLLQSAHPAVQEEAAGALRNLAMSDENERVIALEYNAIPRLVQLVEHGTPAVQEQAAGAIYNLSFHHYNGKAIRLAMPHLEAIAGSHSAPGREKAIWLLKRL